MVVQRYPGSLAQTDYVVNLSELSVDDKPLAGAKGAYLGELVRAGFPVPDGFVLTTAAHARFMAANSLGPGSPPDAALAAALPPDIAGPVADAAAALCECPLAVRSSGVAEDLANASFAGQYETVLDVRGAAAVTDAVRRVWASALSQHVAAYRAAQGQDGGPVMAVVVQRLVPAEAAGVAFTTNPVSGDRTETIVSAVCGLGDRLVAGQASPDEWVVRGDEAVCRVAPEGAISAEQARAVAELARRVEAHFGGVPQDIEWAMAGGETYLLQARPITTLLGEAPKRAVVEPVPVTVEPPPGFWQREASHSPLPQSPMLVSIIYRPRNAKLKRMCDEFGFLVDRLDMQLIGGWEYMRLVPLGGKDRAAPPDWLMPVVTRIVPAMRRRIKESVAAMRADKPGGFIEQWYQRWQPEFARRGAELHDVPLSALSDTELDDHLAQTVTLLEEAWEAHFLLHGAVGIVLAEFAFTCRDLLGWDEPRAFEMLNGLSYKSTEPARALADLALMARQKPAVRRLFDAVDGTTVGRIAETDGKFADAFAAYQHRYGCRCLRYEVADPTVAETPVLLLNLIRDQILRDFNPSAAHDASARQRAAAVTSARTILATRPADERQHFERALARAERAYPVREDNEFFTVSAPLALIRYAVLEFGTRLVQRGIIEQTEDVFFLEVEEARSALARSAQFVAGSPVDLRDLVLRRMGERLWIEGHAGPGSYGKDPGPPPSFTSLPTEARLAMESLLWTMDHIFAAEQSQRSQGEGNLLRGLPASAGSYTGPVRLVMGEAEFDKVQAGDVLVCPVTSPVWSVLFPSIGALVTDTGGILSHPAIIAREYRIPAIVATGTATGLLHDGQMVTVDGTAGTVEVLEPS